MKINSFVSDANARLATLAKSTGRCDTKKNPRKEREDKIRQLKVESEIEAMQLYEKYQSTKMEELKLIRDLLEEDSFVI